MMRITFGLQGLRGTVWVAGGRGEEGRRVNGKTIAHKEELWEVRLRSPVQRGHVLTTICAHIVNLFFAGRRGMAVHFPFHSFGFDVVVLHVHYRLLSREVPQPKIPVR